MSVASGSPHGLLQGAALDTLLCLFRLGMLAFLAIWSPSARLLSLCMLVCWTPCAIELMDVLCDVNVAWQFFCSTSVGLSQ